MNMFCNTTGVGNIKRCSCRDTMQWNDEALECQVFIVSLITLILHFACKMLIYLQDVNCTDVKAAEAIAEEKGDNNETLSYDDSFIYNMTDVDGQLNITEISADEVIFQDMLHWPFF